MAKTTYDVTTTIGTGTKVKYPAGRQVELDSEHKDTLRWLKAGAIEEAVKAPEPEPVITTDEEAAAEAEAAAKAEAEEKAAAKAKAPAKAPAK